MIDTDRIAAFEQAGVRHGRPARGACHAISLSSQASTYPRRKLRRRLSDRTAQVVSMLTLLLDGLTLLFKARDLGLGM